MKQSPFQRFSWLSLRVALFSGAVTALLTGLLVTLLTSLGLLDVLGIGVAAGAVAVGVMYAITRRLQVHRLELLNRITQNIANKRFEDYAAVNSEHRDELDFLITQSIRASQTVEREIQRLNRIENYRKEFIGDISHELKTPIFAIQGFIETLLDGAIDDPAVNRRFLEKAKRNVNRLTYLTKDLMEISKLETGELKSEIQEVYIRDIIMDVADSLQYKAQKEQVQLTVEPIDNNVLVRADRNQIKQVLINLIENGIKYNSTGGHVTVGTETTPAEPNRLFIFVQDDGIGIDEQYIERVTERFFRVDKSRSREKGGTGLGLAIVKHIMEAHDEQFSVESTPGQGSRFTISLTKVERTKISV